MYRLAKLFVESSKLLYAHGEANLACDSREGSSSLSRRRRLEQCTLTYHKYRQTHKRGGIAAPFPAPPAAPAACAAVRVVFSATWNTIDAAARSCDIARLRLVSQSEIGHCTPLSCSSACLHTVRCACSPLTSRRCSPPANSTRRALVQGQRQPGARAVLSKQRCVTSGTVGICEKAFVGGSI